MKRIERIVEDILSGVASTGEGYLVASYVADGIRKGIELGFEAARMATYTSPSDLGRWKYETPESYIIEDLEQEEEK